MAIILTARGRPKYLAHVLLNYMATMTRNDRATLSGLPMASNVALSNAAQRPRTYPMPQVVVRPGFGLGYIPR